MVLTPLIVLLNEHVQDACLQADCIKAIRLIEAFAHAPRCFSDHEIMQAVGLSCEKRLAKMMTLLSEAPFCLFQNRYEYRSRNTRLLLDANLLSRAILNGGLAIPDTGDVDYDYEKKVIAVHAGRCDRLATLTQYRPLAKVLA